MRDSENDRAAIGRDIIDTIRYGDAYGIGAEVMVINQARTTIPTGAWVFEVADKFSLLGVDADDGIAPALKAVSQGSDVIELQVSVWTDIARKHLAVHPQGVWPL